MTVSVSAASYRGGPSAIGPLQVSSTPVSQTLVTHADDDCRRSRGWFDVNTNGWF